MKYTLFRTLKIFLTILVTTLPSMATDQPNQYDSDSDEIILLPIKQNIETQRNYHTFDPQPDQPILWPDEEIPYNARELADVENLYKMPDEIKSYCGFCLGRMQCGMSFFGVKHPRQDCFSFSCHESERSRFLCWLYVSFLIKTMVLGSPAIVTATMRPSPDAPPIVPYIVPVILSVLFVISLIPDVVDLIYCWGKKDSDFNQSIERGRLCLPEDACSCTSLFGYNFYKVRWCK